MSSTETARDVTLIDDEVPAVATERAATALVVGFTVYLVLLTWIVLWKLEVPWIGENRQRMIKLVPFVSTASNGPSDTFDVVANLVLFVPFGVYLGLVAPSWRWWTAVSVFAGVSLALEATQSVLAVGNTDSTDVIVNTLGGMCGLALMAMARRCLRTRTADVMTRVCLAATALALLASGCIVASSARYAPPEDVWFDERSGVHSPTTLMRIAPS